MKQQRFEFDGPRDLERQIADLQLEYTRVEILDVRSRSFGCVCYF